MNSRQRVLTTMAHQEPDRVPCWCGASEEFWAKMKRELSLEDEPLRQFLGDDFRRVFSSFEPSAKIVACAQEAAGDEEITHITHFGVPRTGLGYGQPISHPFADATRDEIESFPWPSGEEVQVDDILQGAQSYGGRYAILGGKWSPYWHDLIDLFGMETIFFKMYDEPELVDLVARRVVDFYHEASRRIFDAAGSAIDIFFIGNDFGSQRGPLVDEATFRRFLLPPLERLIRLGHDYDLPVMLHCCGGIAELLPVLIEVELDAIHALQPCCESMSPSQLKSEFGDRIVLNGGIDSHHVLIEGTVDDVRRATREVLETMMPGGGFIAGASHDTILEETPVENVVAMFETIRQYGSYGR